MHLRQPHLDPEVADWVSDQVLYAILEYYFVSCPVVYPSQGDDFLGRFANRRE
jgi:hypothetical protein